jgi:hypothetical protein
MSNKVTIEPTKFVNIRSGSETVGFRMYDDYAQVYNNTWDSIPDDDMDLLKLVVTDDSVEVRDMLLFIKENEKGICIGDEFYDWEQIKKYLE